MLLAMVYCSLIVIGACGDDTEKTEEKTTIEQSSDPRVIDTLKKDSSADEKEGATRKIN